jgi:hypothetical protein
MIKSVNVNSLTIGHTPKIEVEYSVLTTTLRFGETNE